MPDITIFLNHVMDLLNWIAVNIPLQGIIASGVLSGVLIAPQKAFKKWFEHNEIWIISLIAIVGPIIMIVWNYLIHNYPTDPRIVALEGFSLSFATQPFYFAFWKPVVLGSLVPKIVAWWTKESSRAKELAAVKSAAVAPAEVPESVKPLPVINDISVAGTAPVADTMKPHITSVDVQDFR